MEQRDYFQRQIDQLGKVLAKVYSALTGLKEQGRLKEGMEITNRALKAELDLDIDEMTGIPEEEFITQLKEKKDLRNENLEKLAEVMLLLADLHFEQGQNQKSRKLYVRSLILLEYLTTTATVYSLERHFKVDRIKQILAAGY